MQKDTRNVAPIRLELLATIVDKRKADFYADLIQAYEVNMQMIFSAKGTAEDKMLEWLGLSRNEKAVIFSMVREDKPDALRDRFASVKGGQGISVSMPLSSIMGASAFGFLSNETTHISE